jgi:BirA family biotin operon repressor/biotin-[acetyl-CoA-carboxylase] ligase
MSLLLRPALSPMHAPLLTLLAGLALRDAILEETGLAPDLRWPNDLLLGGKKCAGILTEMHAEPDRVHFVVVGIGVNVNHNTLPPEIAGIATSMRMATGRAYSRLQVVVRLLRKLESYYNLFLTEGPSPIVTRFNEVSSFARGKRVRITTPSGTYVAVTEGLEPHGLLRVRREDGRQDTVISGDVAEAP